jgi:thymidylate synthase
MENYNHLAKKILTEGDIKISRQGVTTRSLSGESLKIDLRKGFPLLTNKFIRFNHIGTEVLWYLKGTDKITYLKENNVHIWDSWADEHDSIGKTYGYQWRNFNSEGIDQIQQAIDLLKNEPTSRRIIVNGWNPAQLNEMRLPPCVMTLQFISNGKYLDLVVYQRSADYAIGVPYDIAEMALINMMVASIVNMTPRYLIMQFGDVHVYNPHVEALSAQIEKEIKELPTLTINIKNKLEDYIRQDFVLNNYSTKEKIKYEVYV